MSRTRTYRPQVAQEFLVTISSVHLFRPEVIKRCVREGIQDYLQSLGINVDVTTTVTQTGIEP